MNHFFVKNKLVISAPRKKISNKNNQQGAVIAEFVVIVGFVLVPLIIGLLFT